MSLLTRLPRPLLRRVAVGTAAAALLCPVAASSASPTATVDSSELHTADRLAAAALQPPRALRQVAFIGDSTLADLSMLGYDYSSTIKLVASSLPVVSHPTPIRAVNRSQPGLATKFPAGAEFTTLAAHIRSTFASTTDLPELAVIAVSSIDLSARSDRTVASLAPELIAELHAVRRYLAALGVLTVFTPVFGGNGPMYNELTRINRPANRDYDLNGRINRYNAELRASDLPLLFGHFRGLDQDHDGEADRHFFTRFLPGVLPDDGVHPNALGQRVYATNLIDAVAAILERHVQ